MSWPHCPGRRAIFVFYYNLWEIVIWGALAVSFAAAGIKHRGSTAVRCFAAATAFLLFGVSDAVELFTGAWWRPWWLLVWKAACVIALVGLYLDYRRADRKRNGEEVRTDS